MSTPDAPSLDRPLPAPLGGPLGDPVPAPRASPEARLPRAAGTAGTDVTDAPVDPRSEARLVDAGLLPLPAPPFVPAILPPRTEAARVALSRARLRGVPQPDAVEFVAACPGCGQDVPWREERDDTRLRVFVGCDCAA